MSKKNHCKFIKNNCILKQTERSQLREGIASFSEIIENTHYDVNDVENKKLKSEISQESNVVWHLQQGESFIKQYEMNNKKEVYCLDEALKHFEAVYNENKSLFANDDIYLWEKLAFYYNSFGMMEKAEHCLRTQATLQSGISDAYLNLGVFL